MTRAKTLLVVSLAVNLFIGGMLISRYVLPYDRPMSPPPPPMGGPGWVLSRLSDGERAKAEALFDREGPKVKALFDEVAAARQDLAKVLGQDRLDQGELEAAIEELKVREAAASALILSNLRVLAEDFSPEGRSVLADGLLNGPARLGPGPRPGPGGMRLPPAPPSPLR